MFLDLPQEVQFCVYDKLQIRDRMALNRCIPKASRIRRTSKTDSHKDRKLAALATLFKRGRVNAQRIPLPVYGFMKDNREDPTVSHIAAEHGIDLGQVANAVNPVRPLTALDAVRYGLAQGTFRPADLARIPDDELNLGFISELEKMLGRYATPEVYDSVTSDERVARVLNNPDSSLFMSDSMVFHAVNYGNEALLAHVLDRQNDIVHVRRSFEHIRQPTIASIFSDKKSIDRMLRYCDIPEAAKQAVLDAAVASFNVDVIELMMAVVLPA